MSNSVVISHVWLMSIRVRYVPGPPRPVWGHQSTELAEIRRLVASEWPGRSRNMFNSIKNILNKAKNEKSYFLGPKIFSRPTQIQNIEFSKNVFSGLYDACTALIRRFVDFGPIFVNFWDLCWGSFETTRRAETDMVVWYCTGESTALKEHT